MKYINFELNGGEIEKVRGRYRLPGPLTEPDNDVITYECGGTGGEAEVPLAVLDAGGDAHERANPACRGRRDAWDER